MIKGVAFDLYDFTYDISINPTRLSPKDSNFPPLEPPIIQKVTKPEASEKISVSREVERVATVTRLDNVAIHSQQCMKIEWVLAPPGGDVDVAARHLPEEEPKIVQSFHRVKTT